MKLTIIGASGHGKVAADIAKLNGYDEIEFLDDDPEKKSCGPYPVMGGSGRETEGDVFIAIGSPQVRKRLSLGKKPVTLVHPAAVVADDSAIGEGTVIMAGAVVNPGAVIGRGCIINTCASVDHDCRLGDYVHVAVGAHLCGAVEIGDGSWIGAGSVVSNNIRICRECTVGAGAVVVRDIDAPGIYFGVPAKLHRSEKSQG